MKTLVRRCAALDVHKDSIAATARTPRRRGGREQHQANRLHKMLQDAGIKLDSVARDVLGVSGRAMLQALCEGTTDPELLAELARGRLRLKIPALREALAGRFRADHALVVGHILA